MISTENKMQKKAEQQNQAVQSQPLPTGAVSPWTPAPMPNLSTSQGLDYLSQVSQMIVQLPLKWMMLCRNIVYDVKNSMGQQVYTVTEDFDCLSQYFCYGYKSFTRKFSDNTGSVVMEVYKPFEFPFFPYCQKIKTAEVRTESGVPMAYIVKRELCVLTFIILNENEEEVLKISSSCCNFGALTFKITSIKEKREVGRITEYKPQCFLLPSTIRFDVHFSSDLDVKMKAAILGTCLLIWNKIVGVVNLTFWRHRDIEHITCKPRKMEQSVYWENQVIMKVLLFPLQVLSEDLLRNSHLVRVVQVLRQLCNKEEIYFSLIELAPDLSRNGSLISQYFPEYTDKPCKPGYACICSCLIVSSYFPHIYWHKHNTDTSSIHVDVNSDYKCG
ncbi:phospholipid scramblase 2-like [Leptodactylus fuscus]|uniref:phospholipid scramblase 2-like n=1 Tax=Leptodactylus fuscus TaxID=238119 RepID=UPI003F4F236E